GRCDHGVCVASGCGNAVVDRDEVCDDGNTVSGDGCRADCRKIEMCGDGILDQGEGCDDGNQNPADGCDACKPTTWQATALTGGAGLLRGRPGGVAAGGGGNIYIADAENERTGGVDPAGIAVTVAGNGLGGYAGDGGPAGDAQLNYPIAVAVDGLGNIYIGERL